MVKRIISRFFAVIAVLVLGALLFAIADGIATGNASVAGTLSTGRSITAGGFALCIGLETSNNSATIRTLTHTVIVAPTSVTVDGRQMGLIPASTTSVAVQFEWSGIQLFADGQPLDANAISTAAVRLSNAR